MPLIDAYAFAGLNLELYTESSLPGSSLGLAVPTSNHVRILGGGASVGPADGNIFLWAAYPLSSQAWEVAAKEHTVLSTGVLTAYCIAADIPAADYIIVQNRSPALVNHPQVQATLLPEFVLVGGGARVDWGGSGTMGSFLYASRPGNGEAWFAAAKDHLIPNPATVTAYAIGVRRAFLDALGVKVVRLRSNSITALASPTVDCGPDNDQETALIAGGAEVHWTGAGSLLKASSPNIPPGGPLPPHPFTWLAEGAAHVVPDPATITAWALALVKWR